MVHTESTGGLLCQGVQKVPELPSDWLEQSSTKKWKLTNFEPKIGSPLSSPLETKPQDTPIGPVPKSIRKTDPSKTEKKRKRLLAEKELENESDQSSEEGEKGSKSPKKRLVWTPSLHKSFVDAVHKLGDKGS
jgi:hypothetical protein